VILSQMLTHCLGSSLASSSLQAIGQRNIVEGERDNRKRRQRELQALVDEKNAELSRLQAEYESLSRIEQEQREAIAKLESNEAAGI
jgi:intraflagellar transport protein 20